MLTSPFPHTKKLNLEQECPHNMNFFFCRDQTLIQTSFRPVDVSISC